jgi:hypothetical protein
MMRANHANDFVHQTDGLIFPIARDREFAEFWIRAETDFDEMDATDQRRMVLFEWRAVNGQKYLTHLADNIPDPPMVSFYSQCAFFPPMSPLCRA